MSDIPDDIMKAANECVAEFRWNNDNRWHMFVARAILAERERSSQLLSEAETREREARVKVQAMHRRAQFAEGAFRGVMNVIDLWEPTLKFHKLSTHDIVMRSVKQDFERAVKKASALQSEER